MSGANGPSGREREAMTERRERMAELPSATASVQFTHLRRGELHTHPNAQPARAAGSGER